ncbi:MAG TPA: hypothetical protein VLH77_03120, partial [Gammaproteobacteria bacterium]|nr:hypothetical protein [Gammaproteobacteria bacterium]
VLSLKHLLWIASIIALPFSIVVGIGMSYSLDHLDFYLLSICILGSYLNLIAALLITYLQRQNLFLAAQIINIMPNIVLIPGILLSYWFINHHLLASILFLTALIPVFQCLILLFLVRKQPRLSSSQLSNTRGFLTFMRHFAVLFGEQAFQIILRTAFYAAGPGFLSVYSLAIRIYSAFRFILIDSFIGSKLALWTQQLPAIKRSLIFVAAVITLLISLQGHQNLIHTAIQMVLILFCGFYLSTLVRIIYFKLNRDDNNSRLVLQFAFYELITAFFAFLLARQFNYPLLAMLWVGYIAKPFIQLLLLRRHSSHAPHQDSLAAI